MSSVSSSATKSKTAAGERKEEGEEEREGPVKVTWSKDLSTPVLPFEVDAEKHQSYLRETCGYYCNSEGVICRLKWSSWFPALDPSETTTAACQSLVKDLLVEHCGCLQHAVPLKTEATVASAIGTDTLRKPAADSSAIESSIAPAIVLASANYLDCDRLCLVIPGLGVVRTGVWATSVLKQKSLWYGSMLPYVFHWSQPSHCTRAVDSHSAQTRMAVVICDPNAPPLTEVSSGTAAIRAHAHVWYVFERFVVPWLRQKDDLSSRCLTILAHSAGGRRTTKLLNRVFKSECEMQRRVDATLCGIAFTDIMDPLSRASSVKASVKVQRVYRKMARNWKRSELPLDTVIKQVTAKRKTLAVTQVSAGHSQHKMTSACAMQSVVSFLDQQIAAKLCSSE